MALTLGGLLQRLERAEPGERFAYLMTSTHGPCRFGVYNLLNQSCSSARRAGSHPHLVAARTGYFAEFPPGFAMLVFAGFMAADLLLKRGSTHTVRNPPRRAGEIHRRARAGLLALMEGAAAKTRSTPPRLAGGQGRLFGIRDLLTRAAAEFAAVRGPAALPTVLVVGEFTCAACHSRTARGGGTSAAGCGCSSRRCTSGSTIAITSAPERAGLAVRSVAGRSLRAASSALRSRHGPRMGWPARPTTGDLLDAARPYLRDTSRARRVDAGQSTRGVAAGPP